jgi:hypothetical protein
MKLGVLPWSVAVSLLCGPLLAADTKVGFIETFALAPDREAVLTQLVPGTEDYYFFHALHFQNTGQKEKLDAVLKQWATRFPESERRKVIENRAALLAYDADPQATLKFLRERLQLQFHHEREALDQPPNLPSTLDQALISLEVFQQRALADQDLNQLTLDALEGLVRRKVQMTPAQQRALLKKLERPDVEGLVEFVLADLQRPDSPGFGEFNIHHALLPEQLDALAKAMPGLLENQAFVHARLAKLLPSAEVDLEEDVAERQAWLDRMWEYARNLKPSFNTLKAFILYRRLDHDRQQGIYDRARFLEYLKLPRRYPYINPRYAERGDLAQFPANLGDQNAASIVRISPLPTDEPLVREYLLELLKNEPNPDAYLPYLRDTYVKPIFAEAKIVNGIGNADQWATLLSPAQLQALKDRVDLEFAPNSPRDVAPDADLKLQVAVKNVPNLLVRIYEVNALGYFLSRKQQLNTDLNIDGLVANLERTHELADAAGRNPFRRVPRVFDFPELKGKRGAWIIEFIGGGKSSRALVRKGQYHVLQRVSAAGDVLTVIDEARKPVKDAVIWLDGRRYAPDAKSGLITVPFTNEPGEKPVIAADPAGEFASLTTFTHHGEAYRLDAQFHIEREQLLSRREATVAIRTALLLGDQRVPLELLQEARLQITAKTLDDVSTTTTVEGLKFEAGKVLLHKFQVPERLAHLHVTLTGKVERLAAGGEKTGVSAGDEWSVNGVDQTDSVSDGHLSKLGDKYVYQLLGKNGEPLRDRAVSFKLRRWDFETWVDLDLRTNEQGRIDLGPLNGIAQCRANRDGSPGRWWDLRDTVIAQASRIHARAGEVIRVAWGGPAGALSREHLSLLEKRAETFATDRFASLALTSGMLEIKGLPPGEYSLVIRSPERQEMTIQVTAGESVGNWIVSRNRFLELRNPPPVQIASINAAADALTVSVHNVNPLTRVHVAATRFVPTAKSLQTLARFSIASPALLSPGRRPNLYHSGREIGDEYRYILERRYAQLFPGNLLPRPGLLLNPWELRTTDLQTQSVSKGAALGRSAGDREVRRQQAKESSVIQRSVISSEPEQTESIDFLANVAPVIYNLIPDAQGTVRIDRKALGDRQHVQVYVEDAYSAHARYIALPEVNTAIRDLRLTRNLDPEKGFIESREVTPLKQAETLTLPDLLGSDVVVYDSVSSVHSLLSALLDDAPSKDRLAKFAFVLQWPRLTPEEKRAKYSEFASHELNFFLSRKDPEFFKTVIEPYLRNKKDKTFMDEYLLGADLGRYSQPWHHSRLNVVEKALLARRVPAEAAATARHLRELWELSPPDPSKLDQLFEAALRGRALTDGEMDSIRQRVEDEVALAAAVAVPGLAEAPASPAPAAGMAASRGVTSLGTKAGVAIDHFEAADGRKPEALAKEMAGRAFFFAEGDVKEREEEVFARQKVRALFRSLGPTKEWAENNYYNLPLAQQGAELIPLNAFWRDFAAWNGEGAFFSEHLAEAHSNFTEIMLALAVLDLPFDSAKHQTKVDDRQYSLTAASASLAFHKQIRAGEAADPATGELLISESFFRKDDPVEHQGNEQVEKYVTGDFVAGVVYSGKVVVTNPTSASRRVQVLLQVPRGSIPVAGSRFTDSKRLALAPYTTQSFAYSFYFPAAADQPLPHYAARASQDAKVIAAAKPFAFRVIPKPAQLDEKSWSYISQYGQEADVFAFLEKNNLQRVDLERIAWRARTSLEFFRKITAFLAQQHVYSDVIWSYAVVHNERGALSEWLRHREEFIKQSGPFLQSALLTIDPIERRSYEHLEYSPLVNQRAHRLGSEAHIVNPAVREKYQSLLHILAHKPALDAMDQMSVVYFQFLQDRVGEALARFASVQREALPTRLQHDYFRCYAAFYQEKIADARAVASQYAQHPVPRWQKLFAEVLAQANEIDARQAERRTDDQPNREAQQAALAQSEPSFDFKVENRKIILNWRNLPEVTVAFYLMDPELMFSSNPFVAQDANRISIVKPSKALRQQLPADQNTIEIPLPPEYERANVLVEVVGAGQRKAQAYHANNLRVEVAENYGQLDLRDATTGKSLSKAYVKVYARLKNGQTRFYKDGYTDLRGRFDYASLNSSANEGGPIVPLQRSEGAGDGFDQQMIAPGELSQVERLSFLILSTTHGALLREAAPPAQ